MQQGEPEKQRNAGVSSKSRDPWPEISFFEPCTGATLIIYHPSFPSSSETRSRYLPSDVTLLAYHHHSTSFFFSNFFSKTQQLRSWPRSICILQSFFFPCSLQGYSWTRNAQWTPTTLPLRKSRLNSFKMWQRIILRPREQKQVLTVLSDHLLMLTRRRFCARYSSSSRILNIRHHAKPDLALYRWILDSSPCSQRSISFHSLIVSVPSLASFIFSSTILIQHVPSD